MADVSKRPIVIIKKKGHGHHGHHGGAWKVAYADFVTAMMAFFLVMWIVGQNGEKREALAQYFRDPGVFDTTRSEGLIPGQMGSAAPRPADDGSGKGDGTGASLEDAATQVRNALAAHPEFKEIADLITIETGPDGLHIEIMDRGDDGFFDSGSAALKPLLVDVLNVIGSELGHAGNSISIDGHTDSRLYRSRQQYDNWDLSAARANAARRVMEASGMATGQVAAVRGYADTRLRFAQNPMDPRNRRISIVVKAG